MQLVRRPLQLGHGGTTPKPWHNHRPLDAAITRASNPDLVYITSASRHRVGTIRRMRIVKTMGTKITKLSPSRFWPNLRAIRFPGTTSASP